MFPDVSGSKGSIGTSSNLATLHPPFGKVEPNIILLGYLVELFGSTFPKGGH
jgi:hypothetical protein